MCATFCGVSAGNFRNPAWLSRSSVLGPAVVAQAAVLDSMSRMSPTRRALIGASLLGVPWSGPSLDSPRRRDTRRSRLYRERVVVGSPAGLPEKVFAPPFEQLLARDAGEEMDEPGD